MTLTQAEADRLLGAIGEAAQEAGVLALAWFRAGESTTASIDYKAGGSPVSEADHAVDAFLRDRLAKLAPQAGWLSEETADAPHRLSAADVFIVDPIDGTRGFIGGDPRWAISIALVTAGRPALAVLHLPALAQTYTARAGGGTRLNGAPAHVSQRQTLAGGRVAGPGNVVDRIIAQGLAVTREPRIPSLAYRLARVASGELDAAIASTDAWDWDIAAADLLVREAGGRLTDLGGAEPRYNAAHPRHGALVAAPPSLHEPMLEATRRAFATASSV